MGVVDEARLHRLRTRRLVEEISKSVEDLKNNVRTSQTILDRKGEEPSHCEISISANAICPVDQALNMIADALIQAHAIVGPDRDVPIKVMIEKMMVQIGRHLAARIGTADDIRYMN